MVKIAVAGGTGELAREVLDALIATNKHEITILTRSASLSNPSPNVTYATVNYSDKNTLVPTLKGVHTVLSFINQQTPDQDCTSQKNLIDACIEAGVKRFAPSEYGSKSKADLPFWKGKIEVQKYLEEINKTQKILEYTLIQPGLFLSYLATPHKTSKYITPLSTFISIHSRHCILVHGYEDSLITLTSVQDIAAIVCLAVEYTDSWPVTGGIAGSKISCSQLLKLGKEIRVGDWTVEYVEKQDLEKGELNTKWGLEEKHPSISGEGEEMRKVLKIVMIGMLLSCVNGAWDVGKEWNERAVGYEFKGVEEFLREVWEGKE